MTANASNAQPETTAERLEIYRMLTAVLLTLPDTDFARMVKGLPVRDDGSEASSLLASYVQEAASKNDEEVLTELRVDRARVFNGAVKQGARPPYESSFLGTQPQATLMSLNRLYRTWGYGLAESRGEQSDHIAKEVGFMQMLCEREASCCDQTELDQLRGAERSFMDEHLGRWALAFAREMREAARTGFYQAVSLMLEDHMVNEAELFGANLAQ